MSINTLGQQGRPSTAIQISAGGTARQSIIEIDSYPGDVWEHHVALGTKDDVQAAAPVIQRLYTFIRPTTIDHMLIEFSGLSLTTEDTLTVSLHKIPSGDADYALDSGNRIGIFIITEGSNDGGTGYFVDFSDIEEGSRSFNPTDSFWISLDVETNDDDLGDVGITMLGRHYRKS